MLHNGARAVAISRELVARGARVTHFVKEGSEVYGSTHRLRIGNWFQIDQSITDSPYLYPTVIQSIPGAGRGGPGRVREP